MGKSCIEYQYIVKARNGKSIQRNYNREGMSPAESMPDKESEEVPPGADRMNHSSTVRLTAVIC